MNQDQEALKSSFTSGSDRNSGTVGRVAALNVALPEKCSHAALQDEDQIREYANFGGGAHATLRRLSTVGITTGFASVTPQVNFCGRFAVHDNVHDVWFRADLWASVTSIYQ